MGKGTGKAKKTHGLPVKCTSWNIFNFDFSISHGLANKMVAYVNVFGARVEFGSFRKCDRA